MHEYTVDLGVSVTGEFQHDVCDRLTYADPGIVGIKVDANDNRHLIVTAESELNMERLQPLLVRSAKEMLAHGLEGTQVVLKDRRVHAYAPSGSAFQELVDRGWLVATSRGSYAKSGPVHRLQCFLDGLFKDIAVELGAEELELSTFMSVDTLRKAGHFNASPQHITFPTHLTEDLEYLKEVTDAARDCEDCGCLEASMAGHYESQGVTLAPAVCYNYYHLLAGQTLTDLKVVTARNKCYRFEAGRLEGLSRLWEFDMREAIFVGRHAEVESMRRRAIERVWQVVDQWGLHAWVENANDPFFIGEFDTRAAFQRNREMKYELRLSVAGDYSVAAASFNAHSTTFGRNFGISLPNGRPACSGCCAWGEERWVLALFSQFGMLPEGWPPDLREAVW